MAARKWSDPPAPMPAPKYRETPPKNAKPKKLKPASKAIPPVETAIAQLDLALAAVKRARVLLEKAERNEDVFQLLHTINDLEYRHLPRARQTACTRCIGYRGTSLAIGIRCQCPS